MKLPVLPDDKRIADSSGTLTTVWWLFLSSLVRIVRLLWGNQITVNDVKLTVASTTFTAPAAPKTETAGELVYILRQDATGGRAIVWSGFTCASVAIDTTANTVSVFRFVYSTSAGKWVMAGQPLTGMTV